MLELVKKLNPSFNVTINDVVPYQFKLPAAPYVAKENTIIDLEFLQEKKKYLEQLPPNKKVTKLNKNKYLMDTLPLKRLHLAVEKTQC